MLRPNSLRRLSLQACFALCVVACTGSFGQTLAPASAASTALTSPSATSAASAAGDKAAHNAPPTPASGGDGKPNKPKPEDNQGGDAKSPLTVMEAIALIAVCGAIGGFVDGLGTSLRYRMTVPSFHRVKYRVLDTGPTQPKAPVANSAHGNLDIPGAEGGIVSYAKSFVAREIELGSLGDALVGVVAAFSVFVVSSAVFPVADTSQVLEMGRINLIGWSLVAGYLGPRLLRLIAEKSGNIEKAQKVANEANEAAKAATESGDNAKTEAEKAKKEATAVTMSIRATAQASPLLEQAQRLLTMNDVAGQFVTQIDPQTRQDYLDKAKALFEVVLKPREGQVGDVGAMIGLANAYYGMAELVEGKGLVVDKASHSEQALDYWKKGIKTLEAALEAHPKSAKARYNLACFRAKANKTKPGTYPADQIFADLRKAYQLESEFQSYAYSDSDFEALREDQSLNDSDRELIEKQEQTSVNQAGNAST